MTLDDDPINRLCDLAEDAAVKEHDGSWQTGDLRKFGQMCSPQRLLYLLDVVAAFSAELAEVGVDDMCSGLSITEYGCAGCPAHNAQRALAWQKTAHLTERT